MSMAFRFHHAMSKRPFFNSKGFPTSSLYGVSRALFSIYEKQRPDFLLAVSDSHHPTYRHKIFKDYKANRKEMPEELQEQIPKIYQLLAILDIPLISIPGFEADDIIATITKSSQLQHLDFYIYSNDKDLMQLVNEHTKLYQTISQTNSEKIIGIDEVYQYFNVYPQQVICAQSLIGDPTDNIPGVSGIGKKTASKLLGEFQTLDKIYQSLDKISNDKLREKLEKGIEQAYLSKKLVTLENKMDIDFDYNLAKLDVLKFSKQNHQLDQFFFQCDFGSLRKKYFPHLSNNPNIHQKIKLFTPKGTEQQNTDSSHQRFDHHFSSQLSQSTSQLCSQHLIDEVSKKFTEIKDRSNLEMVKNTLSNFQFVTISTVYNLNDNFMTSFCQGICLTLIKAALPNYNNKVHNQHQLMVSDQKFYYLDLCSKQFIDEDYQSIISFVQTLLYSSSLEIICYDLKRLLHNLTNIAVPIKGQLFNCDDIMIMSSLVEGVGGYLSFTDLSRIYLSQSSQDLTKDFEVIYQGLKSNSKTKIQQAKPYKKHFYCWMAENCFDIYMQLKFKINNLGLNLVYYSIEKPLIVVLYSMERTGVFIDKDFLLQFTETLTQQKNQLTNTIYEKANEQFNIQSPKQLSYILFEKLKLHQTKKPPIKIRKTTIGYSTGHSTLIKLLPDPLIEDILQYKKIVKLLSTYSDALVNLINPHTNRIHTTFNQLGAATGRLSSEHPNLQNIPIRSNLGKELRKAFCASSDHLCIISADYSQIELRLLAHLCNDRNMIAAISKGDDIHKTTAAMMLGKDLDQVSTRDRELAKAINYGIVYGMGASKLSKIIKEPLSKSKQLINDYFAKFTEVKSYMKNVVTYASDHGYTKTHYGRRRYFPSLFNNTTTKLEDIVMLNAAKNSTIQGTAADLIKLAMIKLHNDFLQCGLSAQIVIQVHDELVIQCLKSELKQTIDLIKTAMENVDKFKAPIKVACGSGDNWLDAH